MGHKKYAHLPSDEKYLLLETSGSTNKKKIYRSKKSNFFIIKNDIDIFNFNKNTHYMNHVLIRNKNINNLLVYTYLTLKYLGKIRLDYYEQISEAIKEINNTKFNSLYITPSIFWNFKENLNLKHYEYIYLAGEKISDKIKEILLNETNAIVYDVYGGTDCGFIGYKDIRKSNFFIKAEQLKLIKNKDNKLEFLRENSGACDFIEDKNEILDLRQNLTFVTNDFVEIIDEKHFVFVDRDETFIKKNEVKIYINEIKDFLLKKIKPIDIKILKYKDENNFDDMAMYLIINENITPEEIKKIIFTEFQSLSFVPKKILIDNKFITKNLNLGEIIKTDNKQLLEKVLTFGKQTY